MHAVCPETRTKLHSLGSSWPRRLSSVDTLATSGSLCGFIPLFAFAHVRRAIFQKFPPRTDTSLNILQLRPLKSLRLIKISASTKTITPHCRAFLKPGQRPHLIKVNISKERLLHHGSPSDSRPQSPDDQ